MSSPLTPNLTDSLEVRERQSFTMSFPSLSSEVRGFRCDNVGVRVDSNLSLVDGSCPRVGDLGPGSGELDVTPPGTRG